MGFLGSDLIGYLKNEINMMNALQNVFHTNAQGMRDTCVKNAKSVMFNAIGNVNIWNAELSCIGYA